MTKNHKNIIIKNLQTLKYIGFNYLSPIKFNNTTQTNQQLPNELDNLEEIVNNCHLCSFSKTRQNILFGSGDKNADIIFVSLAPTIFEDESGKITYGKSGDMFEKMAQKVLNIPLEDIYMLNILKCIPNKNEVDSEIEICKSYIKKQIDIIKPKLIVVFGDICKYMIQESRPLLEIRGNIYDYNDDIKLIPTYHPTFILRNPSLRKDVFEDLKKVKLLMESF